MNHWSCHVVNCRNTSRKNECKFYKFPVAKWKINQRNKWIAAVRRQNLDIEATISIGLSHKKNEKGTKTVIGNIRDKQFTHLWNLNLKS
ncbi:hypothetical protein NQ318_003085 [Aromia moschata]|uniref:THAP-type domain-containing protein n=1 Tax=Aromia moschata TaxID=1265417 RepID=A0AAV8XWU5_9CUCU|nr:hypothetical protein NQ318_003085 [Aromia moschata]